MTHRELNIRDYISLFRRHWWMICGGAVAGALLGLIVALILPKRYKSETVVLVNQQASAESYLKPTTGDELDQRLASLKEQISSRTRLADVIQKLNLYGDATKNVPMSELVDRLQKSVDVVGLQPLQGTDDRNLPGFTITVTYDDPHLAQEICASLASMFFEQDQSQQQQQSQQATQFLSQQVAGAKTRLDQESSKLGDMQRRNAGSLPDEEQANISLLMGLNTQLQSAGDALSRAQQDRAFNESLLAQQVTAWHSTQTESDPSALQKQLKALEDQLATLRTQYTDEYPDVVKVKQQIAQVQQKIASAPSSGGAMADAGTAPSANEPPQVQQLRAQIRRDDLAIDSAQKQEQSVQAQIRSLQSRVQASPLVAQDFKEASQGYQTALDSYNDLLKKQHEAAMVTDLQQRQGGAQFQILDPANLPLQPDFPKKSLFMLGGFGGGAILVFGFFFLKIQRDTSMRNERDVEIMLQVPVLAVVSTFSTATPRAPRRSRATADAASKA